MFDERVRVETRSFSNGDNLELDTERPATFALMTDCASDAVHILPMHVAEVVGYEGFRMDIRDDQTSPNNFAASKTWTG